MHTTLEWLGVATFRLTIGDLVIFLDAYMDRVPSAPPVGLSPRDVTQADFVIVGHSHFDHLAGAEIIAANTGARIIGSHESCRVMREQGISGRQLLPSQGGERHSLAEAVTVRVFPSLHACTWCATTVGLDEPLSGSVGLTEAERARAGGGLLDAIRSALEVDSDAARDLRAHITNAVGSNQSGGPLVYLIETPEGSIFFQDTTGIWTGVLRDLRSDVAILAASSRPNVDGEPLEGTLASFIAEEAATLGARTIVIGHHDDWMPPVTGPQPDLSPLREALSQRAPAAELRQLAYLEPLELF